MTGTASLLDWRPIRRSRPACVACVPHTVVCGGCTCCVLQLLNASTGYIATADVALEAKTEMFKLDQVSFKHDSELVRAWRACSPRTCWRVRGVSGRYGRGIGYYPVHSAQ